MNAHGHLNHLPLFCCSQSLTGRLLIGLERSQRTAVASWCTVLSWSSVTTLLTFLLFVCTCQRSHQNTASACSGTGGRTEDWSGHFCPRTGRKTRQQPCQPPCPPPLPEGAVRLAWGWVSSQEVVTILVTGFGAYKPLDIRGTKFYFPSDPLTFQMLRGTLNHHHCARIKCGKTFCHALCHNNC